MSDFADKKLTVQEKADADAAAARAAARARVAAAAVAPATPVDEKAAAKTAADLALAKEFAESGKSWQEFLDLSAAHGHPISSSVNQAMIDAAILATPEAVAEQAVLDAAAAKEAEAAAKEAEKAARDAERAARGHAPAHAVSAEDANIADLRAALNAASSADKPAAQAAFDRAVAAKQARLDAEAARKR